VSLRHKAGGSRGMSLKTHQGISTRVHFHNICCVSFLTLCITVLFVNGLVSIVHAGGFQIFNQSASATSQAAAFAAQADDPSAIYYNPAGMTQLRGVQISLGTVLVGGHTSFASPTGATAGGDFGGTVAIPPPSNFYVTANLKDLGITALGDLTAGLAVLSPFGTLQRWPDNGPFATAVTRANLELINIKPTLAYKLNEHLSLGLGLDIYTFFNSWGEGQAETRFNSSGGPGLPTAGSPLEINGKDTAAGFNASLLYTPLRNVDGKPLVNVALQYRSQATMHLTGGFRDNGGLVADASTTLVLPQVFTGGIALWPIRDQNHEWKLEIDIDYTGWKSVRNLDVHLSNGATIGFPQNWRSTYMTMIGTEYKLLRLEKLPDWEVALRAGYWHSQTPIPDRSFSPGVPDADNHAISIGIGLLCRRKGLFLGLIPCGEDNGGMLTPKAVALDLAYQVVLYDTRTVSGNMHPLAIPGSVNGTYQTTYQIGSINLRLNF
jgi:long-chain fatty acid transport protein